MIAGPTLINEEEEKSSRQKKMTKKRVKRLRALGHSVNYVSTQEEYYHVASIAFIEQDLYTV